jgi:hypothetical protein
MSSSSSSSSSSPNLWCYVRVFSHRYSLTLTLPCLAFMSFACMGLLVLLLHRPFVMHRLMAVVPVCAVMTGCGFLILSFREPLGPPPGAPEKWKKVEEVKLSDLVERSMPEGAGLAAGGRTTGMGMAMGSEPVMGVGMTRPVLEGKIARTGSDGGRDNALVVPPGVGGNVFHGVAF